jgi:autotransporter-associated beta strand protein
MKISNLSSSFIATVVACASILFCANVSRAAADTWVGDVDANWSTNLAGPNTNWSGDVVPAASGDSLNFDDSALGNLSNTNDIVGSSYTSISFAGTTNIFTLGGTNAVAIAAAGNITNGSSQIQTVNLPVNFSGATTFAGGAASSSNLVIGGAVTDTAASGSIVLTLTGNGTITDNITNSSAASTIITPNSAGANWTILDNATSAPITLASGQINIINGTLNYGTVTSAPNYTVTAVPSDHTVGNAASTGTFNMVNGTLLLKTRLNSVNGNINVSGGALTIWNQIQCANGAVANVATFTVSGGSLSVLNSTGGGSGPIFVASRGNGTFTISGGTVNCSTLDVSRGAAASVSGVGSIGTANINGGVVSCNLVTTASANQNGSSGGSTGTLNLNGGTLRAKTAQANFINSGGTPAIPITVNVKAGGAIIDSNTFAIGTSKPLLHDASLGATPDGGLTKLNTGTLTLSGANTYTGNTTIKGGTLALSSSTSNNNIGSSAKIIVGDTPANNLAVLDVSGITAAGLFHVLTGETLAGYGTVTGAVTIDNGATVGPGNSTGSLAINGNTTLNGTLAIDVDDSQTPMADKLAVNNALDISSASSTVNFNVTGTPTQPAYVFASYGSLVGAAFANVVNLPSGYSINYNYLGGNNIALVAVPEPAAIVLGGIGILGLVVAARRRRK